MRRFSSWVGADLAYALKNTALAVAFLAAADACGGGGCGGCAGSSVIPGGFQKDKRVVNAAGVRLTNAGLEFLEQNLPTVVTKVLSGGGSNVKDGIMTFEVPESNGSTKLTLLILPVTINYTICVGGPKPNENPKKCIVEIDVGKLKDVKIDAKGPHNLAISLKVPLRLERLPIKASVIGEVEATLGTGDCNNVGFLEVPMTADISLEDIPAGGKYDIRAGYTRIKIDPAKFAFDKEVVKSGFKFCGSGINDTIANFFKGTIADMIVGQLGSQLVGPLAAATCMSPQKLPDGTDQCPTGTFVKAGKCRFEDKDDGECVPMLLGMESRFDLSGLMASLSPGTSGGLDFMLASGGNMSPAPGSTTDLQQNGVTLGMLGGSQPFPVSNCVPQAPQELPQGILLPDILSANTVPDWTAPTPPHLGIGLSERFLNHAAAGAYNSGLFCIGISSEQIGQLEAGLFSLLLPSIKQLSLGFNPGENKPAMGIAIRPQKPPVITVGDNKADFTSPLLDLKMADTDLDFYMWSHDRFIRLFTGRIDIQIPINLEPGKDGLALKFPPKNPLSFKNPRISNNTLLLEKDAAVGKLVESIGGLIPASTFANIKPFKLDSALASFGLKLTIPEGGIRKIEKGDDRFLGIFAYLEKGTAAVPATRVVANVTKVSVDATNFDLATVGDHPPQVFVHAQAAEDNGSKKVEYAYQVDRGLYTSFFPERDFTVTSPFFVLQGKHTIHVVSRIAGAPESESEPVALPVIIDVLQPVLKVTSTVPGSVKILADDIVSQAADLKVEARVISPSGEGAWLPVLSADAKGVTRYLSVPMDASEVEVRATDEAGNIGSSRSALIRGRADASVPGSGCGCSMPGRDTTPTSVATFGALALIGGVLERRRRRASARSVAAASLFVAASGASGCTCASGEEEGGPATQCNGKPDLVPTVIGSHTSVAVTKDGVIWVAGYNEGDPSGGSTEDFLGDLVVGQWNKEKSAVAWQVIDGVPKPAEGTELTKNSCGFRGGVTEQGDDVGQYTAMVLDSAGNPLVAYFDRTNGALRVARFDGTTWSTHDIDAQAKGWAGKFNVMTTANGKPVIAYQSIEPATGGYTKAKIRVAKAQTESPTTKGDWAIEDAVVEDKTPCMPEVCASGQKCLVGEIDKYDPVCAATTTGCMPACGDGVACVKDKTGATACGKTRGVLGIYVNAIGSALAMASTSTGELGIAFYDRVHGNLRGTSNKGGKWTTTPASAPIDGWTGDAAKNATTGDRGLGVTLAIDATGNWHLAYADGIKEWMLYKFIPGGDFTKGAAPVTVDDGTNADGSAATAFKDGQHLVGENAQLSVDGTNVKIVYQDSTAGTLRWAKGPGGAGAMAPTFKRGVIKQDGFAGFWPRFAGKEVLNFYRLRGFTTLADGTDGDPVIVGNVRAVTLP